MNKRHIPAWRNYHTFHHASLSPDLCDWLLYPGSFVQRLKQHGVKSPQIQVLRQAWEVPYFDERQALGLNLRSWALVREVLIKDQENSYMFARTVFPYKTIRHLPLFSRLGRRSLGTVLFRDPNLQRSGFEIARLLPCMKYYEKTISYSSSPELWARRSIFNYLGQELLLIEVFL